MCFNCLAKHAVKDCKSQKVCSTCQRHHHTLLHDSTRASQVPTSTLESSSNTDPVIPINAMVSSPCVNVVSFNTTLLGTAVVAVEASNEQKSYARALIDPGAEVSFAAECLVQRLRLQRTPLRISIAGVDSVQSTTRGITQLIIRSRINTHMPYQVNLYILSNLTSYIPKCDNITSKWDNILKLPLADPNFSSDSVIELILGADVYPLIVEDGVKNGSADLPLAQKTSLGWILTGSLTKAPNSSVISTQTVSLQAKQLRSLDEAVQRFWELETVSVPTSNILL